MAEGRSFSFKTTRLMKELLWVFFEVNADKEANLDRHEIRGGIVIQGEYFTEKINEINQDLKKFDLERGN